MAQIWLVWIGILSARVINASDIVQRERNVRKFTILTSRRRFSFFQSRTEKEKLNICIARSYLSSFRKRAAHRGDREESSKERCRSTYVNVGIYLQFVFLSLYLYISSVFCASVGILLRKIEYFNTAVF